MLSFWILPCRQQSIVPSLGLRTAFLGKQHCTHVATTVSCVRVHVYVHASIHIIKLASDAEIVLCRKGAAKHARAAAGPAIPAMSVTERQQENAPPNHLSSPAKRGAQSTAKATASGSSQGQRVAGFTAKLSASRHSPASRKPLKALQQSSQRSPGWSSQSADMYRGSRPAGNSSPRPAEHNATSSQLLGTAQAAASNASSCTADALSSQASGSHSQLRTQAQTGTVDAASAAAATDGPGHRASSDAEQSTRIGAATPARSADLPCISRSQQARPSQAGSGSLQQSHPGGAAGRLRSIGTPRSAHPSSSALTADHTTASMSARQSDWAISSAVSTPAGQPRNADGGCPVSHQSEPALSDHTADETASRHSTGGCGADLPGRTGQGTGGAAAGAPVDCTKPVARKARGAGQAKSKGSTPEVSLVITDALLQSP